MALPLRPADPRELHLRGMLARDGYERWLAAEVEAVLRKAFDAAAARILTAGDALSLRNRLRLQALFDELTRQLDAAYGQVGTITAAEIRDYAATEIEAAGAELDRLLGRAVGGADSVAPSLSLLSRQLVQSIVSLPIQGLALGDWWTQMAQSMSLATRRQIQLGLSLGEDPRQIAARIVPPKGATAPAAWRRARAEAMMVVRTTITAVHADAALAAYQAAGEDVSEEYELVAVRDSRTSFICTALDGLRFRYDDPKRRVPPFHPHCRTTCAPVIDYERQGLTPPPIAKAKGISFQSMDSWLRKAPKTTQAAILGPTRAEWYRQGKLSLRQLVDGDTRVLTLPELRRKLGLGPRLR